MIKLDRPDIDILFTMFDQAPTFEEIHGWQEYLTGKDRTRKRLYRLSRHGLCACDKPGMHPGQPLCWSLSPEGERVVTENDEEYWWKEGYVYEYRKQKETFEDCPKRGLGGDK